jgi:hypothetical protein
MNLKPVRREGYSVLASRRVLTQRLAVSFVNSILFEVTTICCLTVEVTISFLDRVLSDHLPVVRIAAICEPFNSSKLSKIQAFLPLLSAEVNLFRCSSSDLVGENFSQSPPVKGIRSDW